MSDSRRTMVVHGAHRRPDPTGPSAWARWADECLYAGAGDESHACLSSTRSNSLLFFAAKRERLPLGGWNGATNP